MFLRRSFLLFLRLPFSVLLFRSVILTTMCLRHQRELIRSKRVIE